MATKTKTFAVNFINNDLLLKTIHIYCKNDKEAVNHAKWELNRCNEYKNNIFSLYNENEIKTFKNKIELEKQTTEILLHGLELDSKIYVIN